MKFDITQPIVLKKGMYKLNKNEEFSYQLGRLVNADGADLECVEAVAGSIHDNASWKEVLLKEAERFDAAAFEERISSFISWPAFPSLRANVDASSKIIWPLAKFLVGIFHGSIDRSYEKAVRRGKFGGLTDTLKVYYHRLGCNNVLELVKWFEDMDMTPYGAQITQDVLLLGGEKDAMISSKISRDQEAAMPNARSIKVRILTDADEASDHCNFGNIKLAMDVVLEWFSDVVL